jgi:uncharacterized protein involved in propanediol utilization
MLPILHRNTAVMPRACISTCEVLRGQFMGSKRSLVLAEIKLPAADSHEPVAFPVRLTDCDNQVIEDIGRSPMLAFFSACIARPPSVVAVPPHTARYGSRELRELLGLQTVLRLAVRSGDAKLAGHVSTMSARIQQRRLPMPAFDVLLNLTATHQAVGISTAPDARGVALIFDGNKRGLELTMRRASRDLQSLGFLLTA